MASGGFKGHNKGAFCVCFLSWDKIDKIKYYVLAFFSGRKLRYFTKPKISRFILLKISQNLSPKYPEKKIPVSARLKKMDLTKICQLLSRRPRPHPAEFLKKSLQLK